MSLASQVTALAQRLGTELKADRSRLGVLESTYQPAADAIRLRRLDTAAGVQLSRRQEEASQRAAAAVVQTEPWAEPNASGNGWQVSTQPVGGRFYNGTGMKLINLPAGQRATMRLSFSVATASGSPTLLFGVSTSTATATPDPNGVYIGATGGPGLAAYKGANVTGTVASQGTGSIPAGDYVGTVVIDDTFISMTMQKVGEQQLIYATRFRRTQLPGGTGAVPTLAITSTDTTGALSFGPIQTIIGDIQPPALADQRTVNSKVLWGSSTPTVIHRENDNLPGCRWAFRLPSNYDPRVPAPVVAFLHQANSAGVYSPFVDARWAALAPALDAAGIILAVSDNGTTSTNWDKAGNQASLDDYAAMIAWARDNLNTGPLFLMSASGGGYPMWNLVAQRVVGNIAGVIGISSGADLIAASNDSTYQAAIWAAYGATDANDFLTKSAGYRPMQHDARILRGVPTYLKVMTTDTVVPPAVHHTPMVQKLQALGANDVTTYVSPNSGHMPAELFSSDIVDWITSVAGATRSLSPAAQALATLADPQTFTGLKTFARRVTGVQARFVDLEIADSMGYGIDGKAVAWNATYNGINWKYVNDGKAAMIQYSDLNSGNGQLAFYTAAAGTAGQVINWNPANFGVGGTFGSSMSASEGLTLSTDYAGTNPPAPPFGLKLFSRNRARRLPAYISAGGAESTLQPAIFANKIARVNAVAASATPTQDGIAITIVNNATAAASAIGLATNNFYSSIPRFRVASTTTAGTLGSIRTAVAQWFLSNTAGAGGFFFVARFGIVSGLSGQRMFIGLAPTTGAFPNSDPSTQINLVGFGLDASDTTIKFLTNDGTGAATKVDTGLPIAAQTAFFDARLYVPSGNASTLYWSIQRLDTGAYVSGQATTDLPALNTLLSAHMAMGNVSNATQVGLDIESLYIETDT